MSENNHIAGHVVGNYCHTVTPCDTCPHKPQPLEYFTFNGSDAKIAELEKRIEKLENKYVEKKRR